jgi:hypothetical protein
MRSVTILGLLSVAVVAVACASTVTPSATASMAPSQGPGSAAPSTAPSSGAPSQPPGSGATLELRAAPADLGCDAMAVDYRRITFQIDASAEDPVTARTDTGKSLQTFWSTGFQGSAEPPAVQDPAGQVVAADGDTLDIPEGALPRLHGYFVCPSTNALYVLLQDPT